MIGLFTHDVTVTRYPKGAWVNGRFAKGTGVDTVVKASVQPLRSNEVLLLPEGRRSREAIKVYSDSEFRISNEKAAEASDILTIDGVKYEVHFVDRWLFPGSDQEHYKAIALKLDGEGGTIKQ